MPRVATQKSKVDRAPNRSVGSSMKRKARERPQPKPLEVSEPSKELQLKKKEFVPRNRFEAYWCETLGPEIAAQVSTSDEKLRASMLKKGYTEDTVEEGIRRYHARMDALMDLGQKPMAWGFKPRPGRIDGLQLIDIPGSEPLVIRLYDGDMESFGQFCLDFYSLETKAAVNTPSGWVINVEPEPGSMTMLCGGTMNSWELNSGMAPSQIPAGEERFSIVEGAICHLERPGMDSFWFEIPRRKRPLPPGVQLAKARSF
ncbi:hypothetical protein CONPUDRAFT_93537 [Coniophora puteana RWD-64-598 SS2]|uniref:Uncharacterized protein n=1 Tax=Coniophora puteana (strain RWD-64-598) TaxID=741705 RepID=A0A5M3M8A2_CONPW|nr:uncharacterized protein CONPUDRAFT_93537 [Coniophora puteana RWD-64-598 SS2]EIW75273.1 hypothetical protein CONPUDRAFT_93537 [Coniophora puteana RWD-64-598 SS2]